MTASVSKQRYIFTVVCRYILSHVKVVPDPGKGVCADPVNKGAILEGGGPGPPSRDRERQLSPDKGRGKT
jgi:hypothetical protein